MAQVTVASMRVQRILSRCHTPITAVHINANMTSGMSLASKRCLYITLGLCVLCDDDDDDDVDDAVDVVTKWWL